MQIPKQMYGKYADVKARFRMVARSIVGGATVASAIGELVDTAVVPGLIVVDGPSPLIVGEQFHCFTMCRSLSDAGMTLGSPEWQAICDQLFTSTWGLVSLVSQDGRNVLIMGGETRERAFLEAVARSWNELTSSKSYCIGDGNPVRFERAALATLVSPLARLGGEIPVDLLKRWDDRWLESIHDRILAALAGKPYEDSSGH
jgi:hypothetical protein